MAAIGIDGAGDNHVLAVALGATENATVVKALLADLIERGLQPDIARLLIVDALPSAQGTQYHRAARPVIARRGQEGSAFDKIVNDASPFASRIRDFNIAIHGEPFFDERLERCGSARCRRDGL